MKRLPLLISFLLFIALCASAAYWALQLFKPPVRPVAAPPQTAQVEARPEVAGALFGGRAKTVVASNYQLRGVVMSGTAKESVAILSADGKPAQAVRVDSEVLPGVKVKEVHRDYVLLNEGGVNKRVELPESAKAQVDIATASPLATRPVPPTAPGPSASPAVPARPGFARPSTAPPPPVIAPPPAAGAAATAGAPNPPAPASPGTGGTITPQIGAPGPGGMAASGVTPANPPPSPEPGPTVTTPAAPQNPADSSGNR